MKVDVFGGLCGIIMILAVMSVIGEPDILDQVIVILKNYSETIKCQ